MGTEISPTEQSSVPFPFAAKTFEADERKIPSKI